MSKIGFNYLQYCKPICSRLRGTSKYRTIAKGADISQIEIVVKHLSQESLLCLLLAKDQEPY